MLAALTLTLVAGRADAQSSYRVIKPAGAGPHPVALFAPGCSGFTLNPALTSVDIYAEKAAVLQSQGYMVVFVDYFAKRGVPNCIRGITHAEAAADLVEAATWVRSQPDVDAKRIVAVGWSFGGGVVITALAGLQAAAPAFHKAVLLYPDCRPVDGGKLSIKTATPTLKLLAGADDVTLPSRCVPLDSAMPKGSLRSITYPDVQHGFDVRGLPAKIKYPLGTLGYNEAADKAAWGEIAAFLK